VKGEHVTEMGRRAKTMRQALMAGVMWTALAATASLGQGLSPGTPANAHGASTAALSGASLSGRWDLNARACEPIQSPREPGQAPPRGRGPSILSAPSRDEMRRVAEPQPVLVIVRHDTHYAVSDDEGHVMLLRPDGAKVKDLQAWPALERTTRWDGRALVTAVTLSNGARVTQTYTTEDEGLRLVIATRVEGGHSRNQLTYKWVYDQALQ
jgi:hypothetical protein